MAEPDPCWEFLNCATCTDAPDCVWCAGDDDERLHGFCVSGSPTGVEDSTLQKKRDDESAKKQVSPPSPASPSPPPLATTTGVVQAPALTAVVTTAATALTTAASITGSSNSVRIARLISNSNAAVGAAAVPVINYNSEYSCKEFYWSQCYVPADALGNVNSWAFLIALIVIFSLCALCICLISIYCCCRSNKKEMTKDADIEKSEKASKKRKKTNSSDDEREEAEAEKQRRLKALLNGEGPPAEVKKAQSSAGLIDMDDYTESDSSSLETSASSSREEKKSSSGSSLDFGSDDGADVFFTGNQQVAAGSSSSLDFGTRSVSSDGLSPPPF